MTWYLPWTWPWGTWGWGKRIAVASAIAGTLWITWPVSSRIPGYTIRTRDGLEKVLSGAENAKSNLKKKVTGSSDNGISKQPPTSTQPPKSQPQPPTSTQPPYLPQIPKVTYQPTESKYEKYIPFSMTSETNYGKGRLILLYDKTIYFDFEDKNGITWRGRDYGKGSPVDELTIVDGGLERKVDTNEDINHAKKILDKLRQEAYNRRAEGEQYFIDRTKNYKN